MRRGRSTDRRTRRSGASKRGAGWCARALVALAGVFFGACASSPGASHREGPTPPSPETPPPTSDDAEHAGFFVDAPPSSEQPCGGQDPAAQACPTGETCIVPIRGQCGAADAAGACKRKPVGCGQRFAPVCGCDGKTYPNACVARLEGVSLATVGPCHVAKH